jgi:putative ABC transport system permease protein
MNFLEPTPPQEKTLPGARLGAVIRENLHSAFRALFQNWLRSLLTMTGIVIGVLAIVSLVAIMKGVQYEVSRQVEDLGANLVIILPGKMDDNGQMNPMAMMGISTLTDKDVAALEKVPHVVEVAPVIFVDGTAEVREKKMENGKNVVHQTEVTAYVVATNKAGVVMNPTPLAEGRYFEDSESNQNVCILSSKPKQELFGSQSAVGKSIWVKDKAWKVIGVLAEPDGEGTLGNMMIGLSNIIYLPDVAVKKQVPNGQINRIFIKTEYKHPAKPFIQTLKNTLIESHGGREDASVISQEKGLELVNRLLNMATALLTLITAISLFVAGVGIMNIMLVTVTERTHEIGIRKTVGAKRRDIFLQFLSEAIILSLLGGIVGLLFAWGLCAMIAKYSPLTPVISVQLIGVALAVCTTVGVIFGVAPAVRAARLDPIDALRHE